MCSKLKYVQPIIVCITVEMEESIGTSSATINTGNTGNTPKIEEWESAPNGSYKNYDM
ncbi:MULTISPECIES: hypothetical protein [Sphingobacterium]|uniref:Uncharacterized protein n=1 Tax=Sphingobacterium hotanense TaxID=649196 RepID=A0ABT7NPC4_9SPHI|nr:MULTISPECIES: hypothetical protein [Sphingobacterium]MCT1523092.1 hypothetical protein [Sphingobacterium hotanense]MDM1048838.1 hypothetical protein [Sphingobacterium hotanense]